MGTMLATPAPTGEANGAPALSDPFDSAVVTVAATAASSPIRDPFTPARRAHKRAIHADKPLRDPFAATTRAPRAASDSPLRDPFDAAAQSPNLAPRPSAAAPPLVDPFAR